ncbi:MAG: TetR/AcrR family transcriptional regulator [Bryobacterales bacterium]|nr:TetR/AcrR family transcriptional regulator [Bryobacterales bacterium]
MLADANSPGRESHTRQRLSSAERRAAIVKAAIDLFSQRGFRGTTTRELAAAVGVTEPVLYQHFATKRDLHSAIVDQMIERVPFQDIEVLEVLNQGQDDRKFFREVGRQVLLWHSQDTQYIKLLLFSALEGHELAELWEQRATKEFLSFIEAYIARRVKEGAFSVPSVTLAARAFVGMVGHFGMTTAVFRCPLPDIPLDVVLDSYVTMFLSGIRKPEENPKI